MRNGLLDARGVTVGVRAFAQVMRVQGVIGDGFSPDEWHAPA
jgi:hypothetical protein